MFNRGESLKHKIATRRNYMKGRLIGFVGAITQSKDSNVAMTKNEKDLLEKALIYTNLALEGWDERTPDILKDYYSKYDC